MRKILLLISLFASIQSYAQLRATIKTTSTELPNQQTLEAVVTGGSGDYIYSWGMANGKGSVAENSSASSIQVTYYSDAEYVLFVRDRKTGLLAYGSVPVKAPQQETRHLIQLPSERNGKDRYLLKGALPNWAK
ncbi:hypothetical protein CLV58_101137 [Spirosoma oryzae]|uniref:PKD domain-containing protein n=1 Tax=Spirosoma oryzae TaxID=1469603 RepID=A0A2T0TN44_9BACT|nr:hypothetical protein [Spirosoma oryzae]PRY47073.1 hypothetical protein CLV58_101137 [Spirosoma oryzae]